MTNKFEIAKSRREYSERWEHNANHYRRLDAYDWMANQLCNAASVNRVLDVGVGSGDGLLALHKNNIKFIGIEENFHCLKLCKSNLESNNIEHVCIESREEIICTNGTYDLVYRDITKKYDPEQNYIIQSDMFSDSGLMDDWIPWSELDAITCWLIGSHYDRGLNNFLANCNIDTVQAYRIINQNTIFSTASAEMKKGSVIQLVSLSQKCKVV